jgi:putative membrane protein
VSPEPDHVVDLGMQAERTALAWRRTALGVGVGGVVALRLAAPALGPVVALAAVSGGVLAALAFWLAGRRYRAVQTSLRDRGDLGALARPAAPLVAVAVATTLIGGVAVAFVLTR